MTNEKDNFYLKNILDSILDIEKFLIGKKYLTDCANTETMFRIIQSIPSPKAEPFKRWLAKVGCLWMSLRAIGSFRGAAILQTDCFARTLAMTK